MGRRGPLLRLWKSQSIGCVRSIAPILCLKYQSEPLLKMGSQIQLARSSHESAYYWGNSSWLNFKGPHCCLCRLWWYCGYTNWWRVDSGIDRQCCFPLLSHQWWPFEFRRRQRHDLVLKRRHGHYQAVLANYPGYLVRFLLYTYFKNSASIRLVDINLNFCSPL